MIWLLFIPTFTWILFKVGLNACWGFLFAVIIWISVEMKIPFWIWLFIEVIMSLIYFYQLISITEVKPNKCSNCPNCKSDCSTPVCNKEELPKQEESLKQEDTFKHNISCMEKTFFICFQYLGIPITIGYMLGGAWKGYLVAIIFCFPILRIVDKISKC